MEHLKRAMCAESEYDRISSIKESLNYFNKAASSIPTDKMRAICQVYMQFAFHIGVVQLSLSRAQMIDPENLAFSAYESPQKCNASHSNLYNVRLAAYDFALDALKDAHSLKHQPLPATRTPIGDPNVYSRMVTDTALASKDAIFHYRLYSWFIENNLRDELLIIETPFLVTYFKKHVNNEISSWEFLWQYYRRHGHYFKSAQYLHQIAFSRSPAVTLSRRIECLALAFVNIQASDPDSSFTPQQTALFCKELDTNIQNGKLQLRMLEILRSTEGPEAQVAADNLNRALLTEDEIREYISNFRVLSIHLTHH